MLTDENFLKIAHEVGKGSNCVSKKVGAIIVKNTRILSTGYNGTPSGYINCSEHFSGKYSEDHYKWSDIYEIHAEMNAIFWAARKGVCIEGATMYVMLEPCLQCTKNLIAAGIKRLVYANKYSYIDTETIAEFYKRSGVEILYIDMGEEYSQKSKRKNKLQLGNS